MSMVGEMTLEDAAKEAAGNWQRFESFCWFRESEIADPDNWAIIYTHNRDSGLLDQSNADAIAEAMEPFTEGDDPDVVMESHDHWAVGHVDGFSIRVYRNGEITEAFKTYHDLMEQMDGYPVLDEEDYSEQGAMKRPWKTSVTPHGGSSTNTNSRTAGRARSSRGSGTTARAPSRTVTTKAATPKRATYGQRSTPWDMSGSRTDLADTTGVGVKNTHPNGANL